MHQLFVALFTSGKAGISLSNPNYITEIKEWRHLSGSAGTQPEFLFIWLIREVPVALGEILPDNLLLSEVKNITLSCRHETLTQADVEAAAALRIFFFFPAVQINIIQFCCYLGFQFLAGDAKRFPKMPGRSLKLHEKRKISMGRRLGLLLG